MIETAFRSLILGNPAVSSLVGTNVFFNIRPENLRTPCVVLTLVSSIPSYTISGPGGSISGRMQADCLAPTYPQAKSLSDAVRAAVDGYSGDQYGTTVCYVELDNIRDIPAAPLVGSGSLATFGVQLDCRFLVKE